MAVDRIQQCVSGSAVSLPTQATVAARGRPTAPRTRQTAWFVYAFGAAMRFRVLRWPRALKLLGGRVEECLELMVRILLNVRLGTAARTRPGDLLRRLADDFRGSARPGSNRPFTAPLVRWTWSGRMQHCTQRLASQMMAAVFATLPNFAKSARHRNIEPGLLARLRTSALTVANHLQALIERNVMHKLPSARVVRPDRAIRSKLSSRRPPCEPDI